MATVTTNQPVTPQKLADELGVAVNTSGASPESNGQKHIEADVPLQTLEDAVAGHVADPKYGASQKTVTLMDAAARAQAVLDGTDLFTPGELSDIVAALLLVEET